RDGAPHREVLRSRRTRRGAVRVDLSRSRTLSLVALAALIGLSLRPNVKVESAFEWAFTPARILAELSAPLRWLSVRDVRAAEASIAERAEAERAQSLALLASEQEHATPIEPALRAGRGFLHAQVVEPGDQPRESVVIR